MMLVVSLVGDSDNGDYVDCNGDCVDFDDDYGGCVDFDGGGSHVGSDA